jgi:hypothetical protein
MEAWIIPTICTLVAALVGYGMGVYAPWLDRHQSLKTQQEQIKVNAQKPQKQPKAPAVNLQQVPGTP